MDQFKKLELKIMHWLRPFPSLPRVVKKWIAENLWWFAVISLIATIVSGLFLIHDIVAYSSALNTIRLLENYVGHNYNTAHLATLQFDLVIAAFMFILLSTALKPLKNKRYTGWFLLYLLLLLSVIRIVVDAILTFSPGQFILDILSGALGIVVAAYLLFQVRGEFEISVRRTSRRAKIVRR